MTAISNEEIERETELFDRVVASTPANLKEADS